MLQIIPWLEVFYSLELRVLKNIVKEELVMEKYNKFRYALIWEYQM